MWDISDVHDDIREHFGIVGSTLTRRIRGRSAYRYTWDNVDEHSALLSESSSGTRSAPTSSSGYHTIETIDPNNVDTNEHSQDNNNTLVI